MIMLWYGKNQFAMQQKLQQLVGRAVKANGEMGVDRFDADDIDPMKFVGDVTAMPFLTPHRLVIVRNLLKNKQAAEALLAAAERVPGQTVVVLRENQVDARTKIFKDLKKVAKVNEFPELDERKLQSWVYQEVEALGGDIQPADARFLVEFAGTDQWKLWNEVQKLVSFEPNVTQESIREVVEPGGDHTVFELIDSVVMGDTAQAQELYDFLRQRRVEPQAVLGMLAWQLRMLALAFYGKDKNLNQIAKEAKVSPFALKRAATVARRLSDDKLKHMLEFTAEVDVTLKTTTAPANDLTKRLLVQLASGMK